MSAATSAEAHPKGLRDPILETFRRNDPNGDGKLNMTQLCSVLETLGLTQKQLEDLLSAAERRWPKGGIPFEDLINWVFEESQAQQEEGRRERCKSVTGADGEVFPGERVMMMMNDYGEDKMVSGTVLLINYTQNEVEIQFEDGTAYKGPASFVYRCPQDETKTLEPITSQQVEIKRGMTGAALKLPEYELFYWAIPGRAEPIRQAFILGGIDFKDNTPETCPDFMQRKAGAGVQVPFLTVDTEIHTQSKAILLYVGKVAKYDDRTLYPTDPLEAYWCDQLVDQVADMTEHAVKLMFISDQAEKDKALAEAFAEGGVMAKDLAMLDKRLETFGPNVTIGDLCAFVCVAQVRAQAPQNSFLNYKNLNRHHDFVAMLPPLLNHYKTNAASPFRPLFL